MLYLSHLSVQSKASHGLLNKLQVDGHEFCHKSLEVVDGLVTFGQPVLVGRGHGHDLSFELAVTNLDQFFEEADKYDVGRDAVGQQLVQAAPHFHKLFGALLRHNVLGRLLEVNLKKWFIYW